MKMIEESAQLEASKIEMPTEWESKILKAFSKAPHQFCKNVTLSMLLMHSLDIAVCPAAVYLFNYVLKGDADVQVKLTRFLFKERVVEEKIRPWAVCLKELKGTYLDAKKFPNREYAYEKKLQKLAKEVGKRDVKRKECFQLALALVESDLDIINDDFMNAKLARDENMCVKIAAVCRLVLKVHGEDGERAQVQKQVEEERRNQSFLQKVITL